MEGPRRPWWGTGATPLLRARRPNPHAPFENSHGFEKQLAQQQRKRPYLHSHVGWKVRSILFVDFFFVVCLLREFFFLAPEKEAYRPLSDIRSAKGFAPSMQALTALVVLKPDLTRARGAAEFSLGTALTFTHHFRLRRSPHRGRVMRKRPLWTPPLRSNLLLAHSCLRSNRLAGAGRYAMSPLFVGAAGPCTAARRGRNYAGFLEGAGRVSKSAHRGSGLA